MSEADFTEPGSGPDELRIFVSYDREHDEDLMVRFVEEATRATYGLSISGRSTMRGTTDYWDELLRGAIRESDQVVVLCAEHTELSGRVAAEVRIAQEEDRPYVLLWCRRDRMCTKPSTARPDDRMYSWTPEILRDQVLLHRRLAARSGPEDGSTP